VKEMDTAKVSDVSQERTLHVIRKDNTVQQALESLYRHHITSLPVVDYASNCLGFLDILDILSFLVRVTAEPLESRVTPVSQSLKTDDLDLLFERSIKFNCAAVEKAIHFSRNPFLPCTYEAPLVEVMKVFAHGVHRVPVVKSEQPNIVIDILTQSAVNAFLAQDPERYLGDKASMSLQELKMVQGEDKIITVSSDTAAVDAFLLMHEQRLSDVGVVNERGAFQGCLSASDLKFVTDYKFRSLLMPVMEFLRAIRSQEGRIYKNFMVYCTPETTLASTVTRLASEQVHRIFIVNGAMKPVGVVSITDIARVVSGEKV